MSISRRDLMRSVAGAAFVAQAPHISASKHIKSNFEKEVFNSKWMPRKFFKKPNIVIAILDDVGFGDLGCFGSEIDTSNIDKLSKAGVRYNNFHVTALCAPTRASLLTGKNAHKVGVGNIAEWGRPLPGYRGYLQENVKLLPQMLKEAGYNTFAVGKWHLSMVNDQDAMGPFNHWPIGRGFDHWYGFHGSAVDHYHPELFRNQSQVYPQKNQGYHLSEDLVDQSIGYVRDHITATPDKPFFLYLGFGACHFPFHAPKNYIDKYDGVFDSGYDELRAPRLARQKELGVCPENTKLTPRDDDTPAWDDLPKNEKRFSAKTQQAFAGMLDHADKQLGRLVNELESVGELDDTILIIMSDNGAGGGYHRAGALDVRRIAYIEPESVTEKINGLENVGTERSSPLYSTGWSFLGNTPLKRRKGDTYEGGTRSPFIVHWPNGKLSGGTVCNQYHHVVDVVPFLLELSNSTEVMPNDVDGISFAYTLDNPTSKTTKMLQHYETAGDRAIWANGWKAVTIHQKGTYFKDDIWALYNSDNDFSELIDLSKKEPELLKKLINLWEKEAKENNVLPLDDDLDGLYAKIAPKPRDFYKFFPNATRYNRLSAPDIYHHDFDIKVDIVVEHNSEGCIIASGDSAAGYEIFLKDGYINFVYVYTREKIFRMKSKRKLTQGNHKIHFIGKVSGQGSAKVSMMVNGEIITSLNLTKMWKVEALNAGIRCAENMGAPISFDYIGSFPLTGFMKSVDFHLSL